MTKKEKFEMLTVTTLAFTEGIIPKNLNRIAPDYVYYAEDGVFINVFLTEQLGHDVVGAEVFSEKNTAILKEAKGAVRENSNRNSGMTVVFPTLLNTEIESIVGIVVTNVQVLI